MTAAISGGGPGRSPSRKCSWHLERSCGGERGLGRWAARRGWGPGRGESHATGHEGSQVRRTRRSSTTRPAGRRRGWRTGSRRRNGPRRDSGSATLKDSTTWRTLRRRCTMCRRRAVDWVPTRQPGFGRTASASGDFPFSVREKLLNSLMQGQRNPENLSALNTEFVSARTQRYSTAASGSDWMKMSMLLRDLQTSKPPTAAHASDLREESRRQDAGEAA